MHLHNINLYKIVFLLLICMQILPDSIRGAVLGLTAYAPSNIGAIFVSFGSPSVGFANALGRVFDRVCLVVKALCVTDGEELTSKTTTQVLSCFVCQVSNCNRNAQ